MTILKNFDLDEIRRKRARQNASGGVDLLGGLRQIAPEVEKLKVGETAKIGIPKGSSTRKFVMGITAKLNNLVPQGGDWAGRQYGVISDSDEGVVYVQRGEDLAKKDIPVRNRRGGGRPPKASSTDATNGAIVESVKDAA